MSGSLGYRNCNPGNIVKNPAFTWEGEIQNPTSGRFCQFIDPVHGIRALMLLLLNYHLKHGCETVSEYINRWAPGVENNTTAYIGDVCETLGTELAETFTLSSMIDVSESTDLLALTRAIIHHENGICVYPEHYFESALDMARRAMFGKMVIT